MIYDASLKMFSYDKEYKILSGELSTLGVPPGGNWPNELRVLSPSGRTVSFLPDRKAAVDNEYWDGEFYLYKPVEECNVKSLTLYND